MPSIAIAFNDVTICPAASSSNILQEVNFLIPRGSFTFVLGKVGSGKSSLLRAILGHAHCEKGLISVSRRDIKWYKAIIHACALDHDLKLLANGDRTQIGSGSSTILNGGQIQRIALARALYARKKIFLLDGVFSALDNVTKKVIMTRLFGKSGLFRQLNSTVVLVTNESKPENTKPYAILESFLTMIQPIISHMPVRSLSYPTEN